VSTPTLSSESTKRSQPIRGGAKREREAFALGAAALGLGLVLERLIDFYHNPPASDFLGKRRFFRVLKLTGQTSQIIVNI